MRLEPGTTIRGCEIVSRIDEGGMGTVYLARQRSLDRDVVVKLLHDELVDDEELVKRFYREAQAAARLQHPNIVAVLDTGTEQGPDGPRHVIVMEYVRGTSVERLIDERGPLPVKRALEIVADSAAGLAAAHEAGIVHRDIKPGNLRVEEGGRVKVADFGIAKLAGDDLTRLTKTDMMIGTMQYASPEQFEGLPIDGRSDIYSLGITLYHMLIGARPFDGKNTLALINRVINEVPPPVSSKNALVHEAVSQLVDRMIAKHADQRIADADQLLRAVQSLQLALGFERPTGATELRKLGIDPSGSSRRVAAAAGGGNNLVMAALLVVGAALLGWLMSVVFG